jgi:hypothetical protein
MLNPLELSAAEIEMLIYLGEGWLCDPIESVTLLGDFDKKLFAAKYRIEFVGNFISADVNISFKPNTGELIAEII